MFHTTTRLEENMRVVSKVVNQHTELQHTPSNLKQKAISAGIPFIVGF